MQAENKKEIWLVRHAQSMFNCWDEINEKIATLSGLLPSEVEFVRKIANKHDAALMDPILSHKGELQAIAAQSLMNTLPVKYVFVSPLHRTLETCRLLFDTHPKKEAINFIVHPMIREVMNNPDDIPLWTLDKYPNEYQNYDFSLIENHPRPYTYFLDTIDKEVNETVSRRLALEGESEYPRIMLEYMVQKWKTGVTHYKKVESYENGRRRGIEFCKWLKAFMEEKGVKPEEVVVVAHSVFLRCLVATEFTDYKKPIYHCVKNADPFKFDIESLFEGPGR